VQSLGWWLPKKEALNGVKNPDSTELIDVGIRPFKQLDVARKKRLIMNSKIAHILSFLFCYFI